MLDVIYMGGYHNPAKLTQNALGSLFLIAEAVGCHACIILYVEVVGCYAYVIQHAEAWIIEWKAT